jgi:glycosyltransferase involved in cell wall biosynthesis
LRFWAKRFVERYVGVYAKLGAWATDAGIPPARVSVIGNALDLARIGSPQPSDIRAQLDVPAGMRLGVMVAGLREEKGLHVLLDGLARSALGRSVKILIIGGERDGDYVHRCRQQADSLALNGAVRFLGERDDVPSLIQAADFAVVPSVSESGPLVLLEYLASGLPIVASRVGHIANYFADAGLPEFVPPADADALAEAIDRLLTLTPDEWRTRGSAGRELTLREFDITRTMDSWYSLYRAAIAEYRA